MDVILITEWSFGRVIFLHAVKAFSWFFSYSVSKSSWKASGAPPNSKHEIPLPSWTRGWEPPPFGVSREDCHHQSQLPEEWAGARGKESLGLGHESCSALLRQIHAATWFPLQPPYSETRLLRHPGGRTKLRPCVPGARRTFPAYHNYRNICAQQLPAELLWKFTVFDAFRISHFSAWGRVVSGLPVSCYGKWQRSQFPGSGWNAV